MSLVVVASLIGGEVKLFINGKLTRFQLAAFTSSYSNYRYAELHNKQDTMAFMESHVSFFKYTPRFV